MYIERCAVPSTTYGAADVVKAKIKAVTSIKSIIFGARDADINRYATTILLIADEGSFLFDTTNLTMERSPRELEFLNIFDVIKSVGAMDKSVYIPARTPSTDHMSAVDAANLLNHYAVDHIFPDWRRFTSIFNDKFEMYSRSLFYSQRWDEFISSTVDDVRTD